MLKQSKKTHENLDNFDSSNKKFKTAITNNFNNNKFPKSRSTQGFNHNHNSNNNNYNRDQFSVSFYKFIFNYFKLIIKFKGSTQTESKLTSNDV